MEKIILRDFTFLVNFTQNLVTFGYIFYQIFLTDFYRNRLLISAYFSHSCTSLVYGVYA